MDGPDALPPYDAVLLAGGSGRRLGGADKAALEYAGSTLLDHALAALAGAGTVVVVGPEVPTPRPVAWTREEPAGGGPVAGLLAGVTALAGLTDQTGRAAWVAVLAVDMPLVNAATIDRLRLAAIGHDGAFLADGEGRRQLAGVLAPVALAGSSPADPTGWPLHRLLDPLELVLVPARGGEAHDIDTWADLS